MLLHTKAQAASAVADLGWFPGFHGTPLSCTGLLFYTLCRVPAPQFRCYSTGVARIWGPPDYGDPRPNITSDIGTGVTISLSDMRLPIVPIALAVWGSLALL